MGLLAGSSVYLIGAVDHAADPRKWRKDITKSLLAPLNIRVYDPLVKPSWFNQQYPTVQGDPSSDFIEFKALLNGNYIQHNREQISARMCAVRKLCLRMAHDANFIIGFIPKQFTWGTFEELTAAASSGKPILLYLPDGLATSTWAPAQIGPSFFDNSFTTIDALYNRVRSIDSGFGSVDNFEWMFLSYFNDEGINEL